MAWRIVSFDGGGIRGLLTVRLLERLDRAVPGWLGRTQLFAGTSTGGLLALGLAKGMSPADLRRLYEERGADIFRDSWFDDLIDLGRLVGAEYDNRRLRDILREHFGDLRLRDLRRRVLIPAFDLDNEAPDPGRRSWAAKFFHNFPGPDSDGARRVRDVALYTTAAPSYFPSADGYIDGGVIANNPSMVAIAQTQDCRSGRPAAPLRSLALLSFGTGRSLIRIEGDRLDWGLGQWAKPLLGILTEGGMGVVDYQCRQLLGSRYHRLCPIFAPGDAIAMDAVDRMADLLRIADGVDLAPTIAWLRSRWMRGA